MSADNGIYILRTNKNGNEDYEYRVEHLATIDNLDYDYDENVYRPYDNKVKIKNARELWRNSPVFQNRKDALIYADSLASEISILEYGICSIEINETF